ncbi:MAG: translation elongation factor Ts, partial [Alphaproteobacteria bacterium]|nr:translation elongation factor Ts [Alphaproteobacteria bacterium]
GTSGAAVEINAETDFVARNESFQSFVSEVAKIALAHGGDAAQTQAAAYPGTGRTVEEQLTHNIATIGENMSFRRSVALTVENGIVAGYVHSATAPGLGKIGVLVALESTGDTAKLEALGKQIAMHVAAARPEALKVEDVDSSNLERERAVLVEQAKASGKPDNIIEKMVEGRIRKYYEEVVLLEQVYVIDGETRVKKIVEDAAKDVGAPVNLAGFVRYELGEGIAKKEEDFAAEVAAAMKS